MYACCGFSSVFSELSCKSVNVLTLKTISFFCIYNKEETLSLPLRFIFSQILPIRSRRTMITGFKISGKMLHIRKPTLSGRLLDLQSFVGKKGPGLFHPCLKKLCFRTLLKKSFVVREKLALGKTTLPTETFHRPLFLTAGKHPQAKAFKLLSQLRQFVFCRLCLLIHTSGKKDKKFLHEDPAAFLKIRQSGKIFLLDQPDRFI